MQHDQQYHIPKRVAVLRHEIMIAIGHHTVPDLCQKIGHKEETKQRGGEKDDSRHKIPPIGMQKRANNQPKGDNRHIDGGILLDTEDQQGGKKRQPRGVAVDSKE